MFTIAFALFNFITGTVLGLIITMLFFMLLVWLLIDCIAKIISGV